MERYHDHFNNQYIHAAVVCFHIIYIMKVKNYSIQRYNRHYKKLQTKIGIYLETKKYSYL